MANLSGRSWKIAGVLLFGLIVVGTLVLQYAVRGGWAPFRKPSYHYAFASALSQRLPDIPVAALLRPGFEDAIAMTTRR